MFDILPTPSSTGAREQSEMSSTQTLDSLLPKGGFQVTPEDLSNIDEAIQRDPALLASIRRDIGATTDPVERARFETLFIKGSGVLTIDGKNMSFMEFLTKYPEQKERSAILGKMDRPTKSAFRDWEVSMKKNESNKLDGALIQTTERVDNKKGALNQKLNETEQQTKKLVKQARSLMDPDSNKFVDHELKQVQSDPTSSPIAQDLIKQGSTIEDIQSGRLNSTIEAYIISNNEKKLTPKDPQKALEFSGVVHQMRDRIGVKPTAENIDAFAASKVLGTDRERIVSNMHQIGSSGKYDRMTWDGESRSVIFHGESGTRILDTASIPPRERIMRNGLSISRDVIGLSPEQKEKKTAYETAKGKLDKGEQKYSQGINEFWGARRGEYTLTGTSIEKGEDGKATKKDINIYSSIFLSENRSKQNQYEMIEQELATGNLTSENRGGKLETMIQLTRDMKSTNLSQMLDTGETENHSKINTMLEQRYEKITQLQKANQEIVEAKTEVSKNPQNTENQYNNFDGTARDNLSWLVENRFDRMGPNANDALQQIIKSINKKNPDTTIDLTKPMEQRDHERLKKALEKLGGTADVLTSGDKLPVFQKNINMAISKNPDDSNSIEGLLKKPDTLPSTI